VQGSNICAQKNKKIALRFKRKKSNLIEWNNNLVVKFRYSTNQQNYFYLIVTIAKIVIGAKLVIEKNGGVIEDVKYFVLREGKSVKSIRKMV
jgi:hypothetical protein